jgi:hypothetical protein
MLWCFEGKGEADAIPWFNEIYQLLSSPYPEAPFLRGLPFF